MSKIDEMLKEQDEIHENFYLDVSRLGIRKRSEIEELVERNRERSDYHKRLMMARDAIVCIVKYRNDPQELCLLMGKINEVPEADIDWVLILAQQAIDDNFLL